jgi:hypothetical protein
METSVAVVGSKEYWGPRVWRCFHLLANISDRRDVVGLWRGLLRASAAILPCEKCRGHFNTYLATHALFRVGDLSRTTGPLVREIIKNDMRIFHNDVNRRLGKYIISKEIYNDFYPRQPRHEIVLEIQGLVHELLVLWTPLVHKSINSAHFTAWKNTLQRLLALLSSGPTR